jgi:hypothetical protein
VVDDYGATDSFFDLLDDIRTGHTIIVNDPGNLRIRLLD